MSYACKLSTRYLELANAAVAVDSFAGEDVRFCSEFESLEAELAKAQAMHPSGPVDWQKVVEGSEALLLTQSKDLRVAIWLTWGLYQRASFAGLVAGLALVVALCEQHWQQVHPRKTRTRIAAIEWLMARLDPVINAEIAVKEQQALFRHLLGLLERFDALLNAHLGSEAPLLLPVCRRLSGLIERALANQPVPGPVQAVISQIKQTATQLIAPEVPVDSDKSARKALARLQDSARPVCDWWLKHKASDVRALRLNRTLLWLGVETLPKRDAEHVTEVRGVSPERIKGYRERQAAGQFADLLLELEAAMARTPFWLDGQRMAWECLQALDAEPAMREVEVQLSLLLERLPGLPELRDRDGVPFADPDTCCWIDTHVLVHLHRPQETPAPEATAAKSLLPAWEQALEEALPVLREQGLKAAVRLLKADAQAATGGRARFFWQLSTARLCMAAKQYELARTQLEHLDQSLQQNGLHGWEPELALEVLQLLLGCCDSLPQSHVVREHREQVHRRLCHLDLEVVLQ